MRHTLLLISTNREMEQETRQVVQLCSQSGAQVMIESGSADVAYARNRALSFACDTLRNRPELETVLMVDDDMAFQLADAQRLIDRSRELVQAVSGVYATKTAHLAAQRWPEKPALWLVGLGCMAVPRVLLLELEQRSESFLTGTRRLYEFTWCRAEAGSWVAEDYRLSMRLGGVHLEPVALGHVKKGVLWPDEETIEAIEKGGRQ